MAEKPQKIHKISCMVIKYTKAKKSSLPLWYFSNSGERISFTGSQPPLQKLT